MNARATSAEITGPESKVNGFGSLVAALATETLDQCQGRSACRQQIDGERRWTREYPLTPGGETRVSADEFSITSNPIRAQSRRTSGSTWWRWARCQRRLRSGSEPDPWPDGRIEFGVRIEGDAEPLTIDRRFLPATPRVNRWLPSSRMRLNEAVEGHVIARRRADGRTEFGFRVTGRGDVFPASRFVPSDAEAGRWLSSSVISIPSVVSTE